MTKIKKITYRLGMAIAAMALGFFLVLLLTFMGEKSTGPIDDFLFSISSGISSLEHKIILNQREDERSKNLLWFDFFRKDVSRMLDSNRIFYGAYDDDFSESYQSIVNLEDSLGTHFPLIHIYTAWGSKSEESFPLSQTQTIFAIGSIPIITWEPWLADFSAVDYPNIPPVEYRDKGGLLSIAAGNYDDYIKNWAKDAKNIGRPFFVRLGHEMNDPYRYPWGPQNNNPADFVLAWQHVVDVFRKVGANNVIWVWSPHPAYGKFKAYYPGSNYVDWIGLGALNYGTVDTWSKWWSFDEILGNHYSEISNLNKPILITEFASLSNGGNRAQWYLNALTDLNAKYPLIKAIVFFHCKDDNTIKNKRLDWYIKDDKEVIKSIKKATNNFTN